MKRTMTTSGLVVAALALGAFAMSTLPAEAGRARSGARIGPFLINGAHASVGYHSQPQPTPSSRPNPKSTAKPESIAETRCRHQCRTRTRTQHQLPCPTRCRKYRRLYSMRRKSPSFWRALFFSVANHTARS